jgi:hypothetical protein
MLEIDALFWAESSIFETEVEESAVERLELFANLSFRIDACGFSGRVNIVSAHCGNFRGDRQHRLDCRCGVQLLATNQSSTAGCRLGFIEGLGHGVSPVAAKAKESTSRLG